MAMDLSFRVDAMQADGEWFGVIRLMQIEVGRTSRGYESRGKAEVAAKIEFAEALRDILADWFIKARAKVVAEART